MIWVVETGSGWFVTLCEAGTLAKIGLNDAGLGVCLNLLRSSEDGGHDGTPIHILLRQVLATCRSVDEAVVAAGVGEGHRVLGGDGRPARRRRHGRALTRRRERAARLGRRAHQPLPRAAAGAAATRWIP